MNEVLVWVVLGIRSSVQYEDLGAEEIVSIHRTEAGAEAVKAKLTMSAEDSEYDGYDVESWELSP